MNIATIVSIAQEGDTWTGQDGTPNYPLRVVLNNGVTGLANAKKPTPPYSQGDVVGYELKGQDKRGNVKLKIDKKAAQQAGSAGQPQQQATQPAAQQQPAKAPGSADVCIRGDCVGNTFKIAADALKTQEYSLEAMLDGTYVKHVWELASQLIRCQDHVEHGGLAPKPAPSAVANAQNMAAQHGFVPATDVNCDVPF